MEYNKFIDHTILKPEATSEQVRKICHEAIANHFASVCINPTWVPLASDLLNGTDVKVCTVIGFPLGANVTRTKIFETKDAIDNGASEIDMVANIGWIKDNDFEKVTAEINEIKSACGSKILKVIVETCLLNDHEKTEVCKCVIAAGADFIKTSTGFSTGGAKLEDIKLWKKIITENHSHLKIKASGGVKTRKDMIDFINAGADRIGTSSGVTLIKE
ncbi:MAG: deoxyribose-phosphate aldolase [Mycoplasmataceae bacterium]|nr:deoxyribose-phosphate aldolase [Mycoplasmataceae bacterium]